MAAAAITLALTLAEQYGPAVITFIKQIRKKDNTGVVTSVTILAKLDEADADYASNVKADADWFAAHGMLPSGDPVPAATAPAAGAEASPKV